MEFAVVLFRDENDSTGIISTNWISPGEKSCLFPNAPNEASKNDLLIARKTPGKKWKRCRIKCLRQFPNYDAAKNRFSDAEYTSNLDSESEIGRSRTKKRRTHDCSPIEYSTSEDEQPSKSKRSLEYPSPPSASFEPVDQSNQLDFSQSTKNINSSRNKDLRNPNSQAETSQHSLQTPRRMNVLMVNSNEEELNSDIYQASIKNITSPRNKDLRNPNSQALTSNHSPLHPRIPTPRRIDGLMGNNNEDSSYSELRKIVPHQQLNLKNLCGLVMDSLTQNDRLEFKIDSMRSQLDSMKSQMEAVLVQSPDLCIEDSDLSLISSLPLRIEDDFNKLDKKIADNPAFKKKLTTILMATGGNDSTSVTSNIMRKLIVDELGRKFSLTGRATPNNPIKRPFEKTELYRLIIQICCGTCEKIKTRDIRTSVSQWLMQSRFRMDRREIRKTERAASQDNSPSSAIKTGRAVAQDNSSSSASQIGRAAPQDNSPC